MKLKKFRKFTKFFYVVVLVLLVSLLSLQMYSKIKSDRATAIKEQAKILKRAIDQFIVKYDCEPWRFSEKGCDENSIYGPKIYLTGNESWLVTDKYSLYKTGYLGSNRLSKNIIKEIYFSDEYKNNKYTLCYKNLQMKTCIPGMGDISQECEEYMCLTSEYSNY